MTPMKKLARIAGLTGIVLLAFGIVHLLLVFVWPIRESDIFRLVFLGLNIVGGLALLVLALVFNVEGVKALTTRRSALYSTNAVVYSGIAIAILAALNWVSYRHHHQFDLTESKLYTLSDQSRQILANLTGDLEIYAFLETGSEDKAKDVLEPYKSASPKVKVEYVDPNRRPELARNFGITRVPTIYLQSGTEKVSVNNITEQDVTNGIIKATRQGKKTVCFVEGHGEPDIEAEPDAQTVGQSGYDFLKKSLTDENYEAKKVLLATQADVPKECVILVDAGPQAPLQGSEIDAIGRFLDAGGKALLMPSPEYGKSTHSLTKTGLEDLLGKWGVEVGNDLVLDRELRLFSDPVAGLAPLAQSYGAHPITKDSHAMTRYPFVRSVKPKSGNPAGLTVTTLVRTGNNSWADTRIAQIFESDEGAELDLANNQRGPISIAVAVSRKAEAKKNGQTAAGAKSEGATPGLEEDEMGGDPDAGDPPGDPPAVDSKAANAGSAEKAAAPGTAGGKDQATKPPAETRIVVVGSAAWLSNQSLMGGFGGNSDLALNMMGWLGGEEDLISIRPKTPKASRIALTPEQRTTVFTLSFLLFPEILVVAGLVIWWRRR